MSSVNWGKRPSANKAVASSSPSVLDSFVNPARERATKRLNLNISAGLHARIKAQCALDGRDMTEVLVELLEARFPAMSK